MPKRPDPFAGSFWVRSAGTPPASPALGRERIVTAAVALLDADGVAGLSMRRLGAALGSGATSVYHYVANKGELLDLALDQVMGEIATPESGDWRESVTAYAHGLRAALLGHPWLVAIIGTRPGLGPNANRLADWLLGEFSAAGFSVTDSAYAGSALGCYILGATAADVSWEQVQAQSGLGAAELEQALAEFYGTNNGAYPNLDAWWRSSSPIDMTEMRDATFAFGLDRFLDGLAAWLGRR